jgi:tetratricopeptide (TPR) repeat protein
MSWGFLQRYEATNSKIPFSVFDLHPIVRHYSYSRFAEPDRISIHARLRIYFGSLPKPSKLQEMKDLALLIEQYYHTVCSGRLDEGFLLFHDRINQAAYYQFGAYQLQIELLQALFLDGEDKPPRLNNEGARNWTLNELANSYSLNGQPSHAMTLFEQAVAGAEKLSDQENFTLGLGNLAHMAQIPTGRLNSAEANLRRKIAILRERGDNFNKAGGHLELSHVLTYCGQWR